MPSQLHETHLFLFGNQPALAADLICEALGVKLPPFREARVASLSAMAHGQDADVGLAVEIARAAEGACSRLDSEHSRIYLDLILSSLGEAARSALKKMDARTYVYQSDFARGCIAKGRAEGRAEGEAHGRTALIMRLLTRRFGPLDSTIETRIQGASIDDLESIGERCLLIPRCRTPLSCARCSSRLIRSSVKGAVQRDERQSGRRRAVLLLPRIAGTK